MNERIRKLAEQAGFYFYSMHDVDGQDLGESVEADSFSAVNKFAALVAAAEREACAKVCERIESHHTIRWRFEHDSDLQGRATGAAECAAAIRARGQA